MIDNAVKLVIWDLDDTFWQGTLSEEGITPIAGNLETVIELSRRGIVNSICSNNDPVQAMAKLAEMGAHDYFVFPSISFSPKGKAVAGIIENAALRAENVLFLDDSRMNLEEVKFFNPGIMAFHPGDFDAAGGLLGHPQLAGKPDPDLVRLKQYRLLQRKVEDKSASSLSNEAFLRASRIRVSIDDDVEKDFDRIVELINRSNQLNYTKKRLNSQKELDRFRMQLNAFGIHAGSVHAVDAYGDYGLIGFFLMLSNARGRKLLHFVFSCRTMHMGIEQYVHEFLGRPEVEIASPVSYGLDQHAVIDWINVSSGDGDDVPAARYDRKLLLLGGCDLLQLANYCSHNRVEFVNKMQDDVKVRYDDPGFILSSRSATATCETLRKLPCWTHEDAVKFDEAVASSELILVSLWVAMNGGYYRTRNGVLLHFPSSDFDSLMLEHRWFLDEVEELEVGQADRLKLIAESFDAIAERNVRRGAIFILGCGTRGKIGPRKRDARIAYNDACRSYAERAPSRFHYVDVDAIVPAEAVLTPSHFSRAGYHTLARHILSMGDGAALSPECSLDAA